MISSVRRVLISWSADHSSEFTVLIFCFATRWRYCQLRRGHRSGDRLQKGHDGRRIQESLVEESSATVSTKQGHARLSSDCVRLELHFTDVYIVRFPLLLYANNSSLLEEGLVVGSMRHPMPERPPRVQELFRRPLHWRLIRMVSSSSQRSWGGLVVRSVPHNVGCYSTLNGDAMSNAKCFKRPICVQMRKFFSFDCCKLWRREASDEC